jgi:hypothetical protein
MVVPLTVGDKLARTKSLPCLVLAHLWKKFFRTDDQRRINDLGLAMIFGNRRG